MMKHATIVMLIFLGVGSSHNYNGPSRGKGKLLVTRDSLDFSSSVKNTNARVRNLCLKLRTNFISEMWCPKKSSSLLGAYEPQPFPLWCPPSSRYRCWPILASVPATSLQLCDEDEKACPGQPLDGALGHAHVLWRPCCFTIWLFV